MRLLKKKAKTTKSGSLQPFLMVFDCDPDQIRVLTFAYQGSQIQIVDQLQFSCSAFDTFGKLVSYRKLKQSLKKYIRRVESRINQKPTEIGFSLTGEMNLSVIVTSVLERDQPQVPVDEAELNSFLADNRTQALQQVFEKYQLMDPNLKEADLTILNGSLVACQIDGKNVDDPINKKASKIVLKIHYVFTLKEIILQLQKLATEFNLNLKSVSSNSFALTQAILKYSSSKNSLSTILINLNQKVTDVAIIVRNTLVGCSSYPIGWQILPRALERNQKLKLNQALKKLARLSEKKIATESDTRENVDQTLAIWNLGLILALKEFSYLARLPALIYLIGQPVDNSLKIYTEFLNKVQWKNQLNFIEKPRFISLGVEHFKSELEIVAPPFIAGWGLAQVITTFEASNFKQNLEISNDQEVT